jgi:hypothetical protein
MLTALLAEQPKDSDLPIPILPHIALQRDIIGFVNIGDA